MVDGDGVLLFPRLAYCCSSHHSPLVYISLPRALVRAGVALILYRYQIRREHNNGRRLGGGGYVEAVGPQVVSVAPVGVAIHCSEELGLYACASSGTREVLYSDLGRGLP